MEDRRVWIVALVGWLNLPLLQRFSAAAPASGDRLLATPDDVELVATRAGSGIAVELVPGERLALRRSCREFHLVTCER